MSALPDESVADEQFQEQEASSAQAGLNGDAGSDDEDDVQSGTRRRKTAEVPEGEEDEDDLFGDEEDAEQDTQPAKRQLDDAELDSGDDEDRRDRAQQEEVDAYEERELLSTDMEIPRQAVPEPSDGEMYLLKVPDFMAIEPQAWQTTTYQPPITDHKSKKPPSATFSAFNTAITTVRWRHSPNNPAELQSNARINRWSDGSLTLQLASNPNVQYEIDANSLAPPQRNPIKPTPTAINSIGRKGGRDGLEEKYDPNQDSFTYLMTPVENADAIRVAHKITTGLTLRQTDSGEDDAIEQLQAALASAANATKVGGAAGRLEVTDIDPEAQRKEAEAAERQLLRDRKKRENAQERERLRTDRALGRTGQSSGRYGGLNVGMLEDEEMGGRGRSQPNKSRAKPRRRRNSEYSEDEEEGGRRFTREDSYDQDDDFLAPSDEDEEVVEDDDDPDDGIVEERREKTPKRDRPRPSMPAENSGGLDDEEDAEGEADDMPQARTKRRRIVDDDEEE